MANLITQRSGNWSDINGGTTPWAALIGGGAGGIPSSGDSITISSGTTLTVDINTSVGLSPLARPFNNPSANATAGGSSGGLLAAGTYFYGYTYKAANAESIISGTNTSSFTIASGNIPRITISALTTGATSANIYLTAVGSGANSPFFLYASGITGTTVDLSGGWPGNPTTPPTGDISILSTGRLVIGNGMKLTLKGNMMHYGQAVTSIATGVSVLQMNPGSTLEFDSSAAPSPASQKYHYFSTFTLPKNMFYFNGTSTSGCVVQSNASGANAFIAQGSSSDGNYLSATYTTFRRIGDSTNPAITPALAAAAPFSFANCFFDTCGKINFQTQGTTSSFTMTATNFSGSLTSDYDINYIGPATTTGTNSITNCVFGKGLAATNPQTLTFDNNYLAGLLLVSPVQFLSFDKNVISFTASNSLPNATNNYIYSGSRFTPVAGIATNFQNNIIELNNNSTQSFITSLINSTPSGTVNVKNNIYLTKTFTDNNGFIGMRAASGWAFNVERNTIQQNGFIAIASGFPNELTSFRNNIVWDSSVRGYKGSGLSVNDLVSAANCDYNSGYNLNAGSLGKGYNSLSFSSGSPGAHDIDGNPLFTDSTVSLATWDSSLGGPGTAANAIAQMQLANTSSYNSAYNITSLLAFVRNGMTAKNPALKAAGYDGSDIGALSVNSAPTTFTLTGPTSGNLGTSYNYTVAIPSGTTISSGSIVITPSDGGNSGVFNPSTFSFTPSVGTGVFAYNGVASGTRSISMTNNGGLTNPSAISLNLIRVASTTYTLAGATAIGPNIATTYTVALPASGFLPNPVTFTPSDNSGGGSFSPTTVQLNSTTTSVTFTYTAATLGSKTLSITNNGGLTNPSSLTVVVSIVGTQLSLTGPSGGYVNSPSSNFSAYFGVGTYTGTTRITPSDNNKGGVFNPGFVDLTNSTRTGVFTYTPATLGNIKLSFANNGGFTSLANIIYNVPGSLNPADNIVTPGYSPQSGVITADSGSNIANYKQGRIFYYDGATDTIKWQ